MDTPLTTAVATPTPAAPPTPAPAAAAPATPPMTAPVQPGGVNSVTAILKSINWIEIGFGILGTAALCYTIYYYKYSNSLQKGLFNEMQNKVDDLQIKVADITSTMESKKDTASQLFI